MGDIEPSATVNASTFADRWRAWSLAFDRHHWSQSWQGRAHQIDCFEFPSPWGEKTLRTRLSLRQGRHLAYLFSDGSDRRALVFPGLFGDGHVIEAVHLLPEGSWLHQAVSTVPLAWYHQGLEWLRPQLAALADADPRAPERRLRLWLEPHPNFAHQLLNGLTVLETAAPEALGTVFSDGLEAFGPLASLFPALQWQRPGDNDAGGPWFELPLSQRPERIGRPLRRLLLDHAASQLGAAAVAMAQRLQRWKSSGGWVLTMSVKARGATAEGLEPLLVAWLERLKGKGPLPLLLIDGFTPPTGWTPDRENLATMAAEARLALDLVEVLARRGLRPGIEVCAGLPLLEALHVLSFSDFYLMHQGTVQHKIGWFQHRIAGVVHANSHRNVGGIHPWGGMGERSPEWFPAAWIQDLDQAPRGPYRFRVETLPAAVDWLEQKRQDSLPPPSGS